MDALARADEVLARARGRANVVTPDDATSPMNDAPTVRIPREVIAAVDTQRDTVVMPPVENWGPQPR